MRAPGSRGSARGRPPRSAAARWAPRPDRQQTRAPTAARPGRWAGGNFWERGGVRGCTRPGVCERGGAAAPRGARLPGRCATCVSGRGGAGVALLPARAPTFHLAEAGSGDPENTGWSFCNPWPSLSDCPSAESPEEKGGSPELGMGVTGGPAEGSESGEGVCVPSRPAGRSGRALQVHARPRRPHAPAPRGRAPAAVWGRSGEPRAVWADPQGQD